MRILNVADINSRLSFSLLFQFIACKCVFIFFRVRMKKRKLVDSAQHLSRLNNNKVPSTGSVLAKKRKKFSVEGGGGVEGVIKPGGDEYAGTQDLSNQEKFLLETKAALKSLSGSWPVAPDDRYEKPNFENLFEENGKKFVLTPQQVASSKSSKALNNSAKASETTNCASIKDVVTLSSSSNAPNEDKDEPSSPQPTPEEEEDVDVVKPVDDKKADDAEDESSKKDAEEAVPEPTRKNDNPIDNLLKIETECEKIPSKEDKKQYFFNNQMLMPAAYSAFDELPNEKIVDIPSSPSSGKRYTVLQPASADSKAASQIQDIAKIGINVIQPSKENAADVDKVKTGEEPPLSPDNPANARGRHNSSTKCRYSTCNACKNVISGAHKFNQEGVGAPVKAIDHFFKRAFVCSPFAEVLVLVLPSSQFKV